MPLLINTMKHRPQRVNRVQTKASSSVLKKKKMFVLTAEQWRHTNTDKKALQRLSTMWKGWLVDCECEIAAMDQWLTNLVKNTSE